MPITAIVNTNQSTTVELRTNKTTVSMLPISTTAQIENLSQIQDVDASNPDNNEVLVYDQTQNKYVIKTIPLVQGGTF